MTERKLTPEQIEDLFTFCEEQDIKYYDVQIELVDHLASAIEQKWKEKPKLSYDDALWSVFNQFGVSGFRKIRTAKEKELRKKYTRLQWRYIAEFFKLPKIIMTVAITLALFIGFRLSNNDFHLSFIILTVYLILLFVYLFSYYSKKFRLDLIPGKCFLLTDHLKTIKTNIGFASIFTPLNIYMWLRVFSKNYEFMQTNNPIAEISVAFCNISFDSMEIALAVIHSSTVAVRI